MKNVIKCLVISSLLLTVMAGCSQKTDSDMSRLDKILESGKIVMATSPDYAPYEFIDPTKTGDDKYVGADIELGKYIANRLGVEFELKIMDFSAVLASVGQGKVDMAISGIAYKPDRAEAMEFSETYSVSSDEEIEGLTCNGHGFLIPTALVDQYQSLEDFNGKKIAAQSGSLQEGYTTNQLQAAQIDLIASLGDGVLRVQSGKSDALAIACKTGQQYADANEGISLSSVTFNVTEDDETDGTRVGIPKGETELLTTINDIIAEVKAQGLYQQWENEYSEYAKTLGIE